MSLSETATILPIGTKISAFTSNEDDKDIGPKLAHSRQLHREKYRGKGESFREAMNRIASGLTDNHNHFYEFRDALLRMRFLPAGRIQNAIGSTLATTAYNCFVSGTIADSFVEGNESIMVRATEAAITMRMGGGIGYDFSTLRPRGALIKKLNSQSTGPISFMFIFNGLGDCTASTGNRRGAQMGILRVDHPDIEEFILAKQNSHALTRFNMSIAVTDEFMQAVAEGTSFNLRFNGEVYTRVDAQELWEKIMRSTWDWAEPGVIFIDRVNRMNNLWYAETIAATNPCSEQTLPPFGACLLGSFNLAKYVRKDMISHSFDFDQLIYDIPHVVRAMDNVINESLYPLPAQETEAKSKRRMGLGVCGVANALEAMGASYGSKEYVAIQDRILRLITRHSYLASVELAKEKGSFPLYDAELYAAGNFFKTLDEDVQDAIKKHGIRNSHLTSIAPTGTISQCADNVTSGIEPVFDYVTRRAVNMADGPVVVDVPDYGYEKFGVTGKRTRDVTIKEHLAVLLIAQKHIESSISKTCNVPPTTPWADFKDVYLKAWEGGAKGITTYQINSKRGAVLQETDKEEPASCTYNPLTGQRTCE